MVKLKKNETDAVTNIVQSISYGTGLICAKVSNLGKVTKTKEWIGAMSKTKGIVKNVEKTVMDSVADMKESFDEGVKSIVKDEIDAPEAEVVVKKEKIIIEEEKIIVEEDRVFIKEETVEIHEIAPQEAHDVPTSEPVDLLEDAPSKPAKKVAKIHIEQENAPIVDEAKTELSRKILTKIDYASLFSMEEFKKEGKDPQDLIDSIHKNKPEIYISAPGPVEWLNSLLNQGVAELPLKYDIKETKEIKEAKAAFEAALEVEKTECMIKLNRLILEQAYPLKCPKLPITEIKEEPKEESKEVLKEERKPEAQVEKPKVESKKQIKKSKAEKKKSKHAKGSDSALNLN